MKKTKKRVGKKRIRSPYWQKIDELDQLWKSVVLLRAGRQCEVCGSENHVQAHHAFPREILSTRFDEKNGVTLCLYHHITGRHSAHRNPIFFVRWMEKNRPDDLAEIEAKVNQVVNKRSLQLADIKNKLEEFKVYLENILEKPTINYQ